MNKEKFHKRSGTTDQGKDYENLLVAYYSLKLVLDVEVADFKISSNDDQHGNFDDLVIDTAYKDGKTQQFNIQAKHKQSNKNKNLLLEALRAEKGKFSIKKRFEENLQNPSDQSSNLILFTNRNFEISDNTEVRRERHFAIYIIRHNSQFEIINTAKEKSNSIYKFYIKEDSETELTKAHIEDIQNYKDFLKHFYLYTNQKNVTDTRDVISNLFQDKFKCDISTVKNYVDFITNWSNRDGKKHKLTKELLQMKIAEYLLSPFILTPSDVKETDQSKLLKNAINVFDITIVSDVGMTQNFYRTNALNYVDLDTLNKTGFKYQIIPKYVKHKYEMSSQQRATILWLLDQCPLILEVTSKNEASIFQAINLCASGDRRKKFVLIGTKKTVPNFKNFQTLSDLYNNCLEIYDKIVSTFRCSFHGQMEATLEEIIEDDDEIRNVFSTKELILMLDGSFNFGAQQEPCCDFYIERKLTKITIDFDFIEKFGEMNPVVISCNGKLHLLRHRFGNINFLLLDELDHSELSDSPKDASVEFFNKQYIYVANIECPRETFKRICEDHRDRPCHHFQIDYNNNLEWLESSKSIENLKKFQTKMSHFVKEKHIFHRHELNVICADAGMGKSLMMLNIKNNTSSKFWIIKVVLREHITLLQKCGTDDKFLNILLERSDLTEFEDKIFDAFKLGRRLILIWDGLDEISKELFDSVLEIIQKLRNHVPVQWITARSSLHTILEDRLNVFVRTIKPFGKKEQQLYIMKRLHNVKDLEKITEELMSFMDSGPLGNPLQVFMLTELYKHNDQLCQKLLSCKFSAGQLYEYFVDEKFNFYYKKANIDFTNNVAKKILQEHKIQRLEKYEIVALNQCLPLNVLETLKLPAIDNFLSQIQKENDCFGILEMTNDTPNFSHRTQAEYFVALWLSKNYANVPNLEKFFFEENWKGIRFMFDLIMAKDCPLHVAVLYKNIEGVRKNLSEVTLDKIGRSPLHIAAGWGETHGILNTKNEKNKIIIDVEKGLTIKDENLNYLTILDLLISRFDVKQKDKLFQADCLQYANHSLSLSAINALVSVPQDLNQLKNFNILPTVLFYIIKFNYTNLFKILAEVPYIETNHGGSLLHECAHFNRQHFLPKFLKNPLYQKSINKIDQRKWAPIHYAACYGHLEMVKSLHEAGADIHLGVKNGNSTPFLVAAQYGQVEVLKYLLHNKVDVNGSNRNGWTPLLIATQKLDLAVVKFLVDHNADVNKTNNEGYSPLYVAVRKGDLQLVKFLLSKNAKVNQVGNTGEGPLYMAAKLGHLQIAKLLIHKKANVNASRTNGWTPLMVATKYGNLAMVKLLLENKAMCNNSATIASKVKTIIWKEQPVGALDVAVEKGHIEIIKLLVQNGAIDNNHNVEMVKLTNQGAKMKPALVQTVMQIKKVKMLKSNNEATGVLSFPVSKRRKWLIIIGLLFFVIIVVLSASSVLDYLINVQWTDNY